MLFRSCDGENPSGLSTYHLLSPYVLRYDIMAAIEGDLVSPSEIARSRNLRAVMFESGENPDNGEFYVGIAFITEEFYQSITMSQKQRLGKTKAFSQ